MTVPLETQGRYLNEIRRQATGTVRCERVEERAVATLYSVVCRMSVVSILVRLLDPENGGLTLLRNMCPSNRHRRLEAQCIRAHSDLMTLLSKILRAIPSCWPDSFLRVHEHVL